MGLITPQVIKTLSVTFDVTTPLHLLSKSFVIIKS
jgi:hypothetical protein